MAAAADVEGRPIREEPERRRRLEPRFASVARAGTLEERLARTSKR
jgi:hypothetical protein